MAEENAKDGEEPLTPEEVPANPQKQGKLKKILIIVIPLILIIAGVVYFYLFVIKGAKTEEGQEVEQGKQKPKVAVEQNAYLDLDPITVALTPTGPKREFLRLDMTLRVASEDDSKAIMEKLPIIKDSLIVFLRSLRSTDFNSSNSTIYLKEEITKRINKITAPISVKEVLFQEIAVN
jgi:flagellar protein FliL